MSGSSNMQQKMLNPRTLRDFLSENNSNEFKSFSRKPIPSTTMKSNPRILNSLLNAVVRGISSFTVTTSSKSPSILPRSLSRKLAKRRIRNRGGEINVVRIKDIVRWRSFRDLAEEEQSQPLDFSTTTTTSSCSSSNGSSWSDSDFTCGYLSSCDGNNFVEVVRNDVVGMGKSKRFSPLVGKDLVDATTGTTVGTTEDFTCQEEEIQSPVSVLQIGEDEFSSFDQNLANIERRKQKCIESLTTLDKCWSVDKNINFEDEYEDDNDENEDSEEQDRIERRARELLHNVKANAKCSKAKLDHQLLLDFFRDELKTRRNYQSRIKDDHDEDAFEWEIMKIAEDWIDDSLEYDLVHGNKDDCIREMERRQTWSKFEEEQEELAWEIENDILENLIVEIF